MNTSKLRIAVIGAGIGGLTCAAALARAGLQCKVYEQAPTFQEVGAGIQLAPNATRLLGRLTPPDSIESVASGYSKPRRSSPGLDRAANEAWAVQPAAIEMRRWDNNSLLGTTTLGATCARRYGAPYYTAHRADLHRHLMSLVSKGTVTLDRRCVAIHERTDGVDVLFSDGGSVTADLVVGADGIHSKVRSTLMDDTPRFSGQLMFRALVPVERVPFLADEPKIVLWLGPGKHCVCYPVSAGTHVSLAATVPAPSECRNGHTKIRHTEHWTEQGSVADLAAAYDDWHENVRTLLAAADTVTKWALHDRDPVSQWSSKRITLVGDAAHPLLPFFAQGANQAVEDAFTLAECLRTGYLPDALLRYQRLRQPRVDEILRKTRENQHLLHLAKPAPRPLDQNWLYGHDAEAAASLPEPLAE